MNLTVLLAELHALRWLRDLRVPSTRAASFAEGESKKKKHGIEIKKRV